MQGPGYALSQFLATAGADVVILGATELPGGGVSEHIAITLPDGTVFGADVWLSQGEEDY
jgi:hypothetical protein